MTVSESIKLTLFLLISIGLIYVSRASLHTPITHGLPRLVAWEAILALFLFNVQNWIVAPFSGRQIVSWLLLGISLVLILCGIWLLRVIGKPDAAREQDSLLGIEKTTALVTIGIYHYIRHPFYSSLIFLAWGTFFKELTWPGVILAISASICLMETARIEEHENIIYFGSAYQAYMDKTKKFIPFLY